jgi:hypothetical protein
VLETPVLKLPYPQDTDPPDGPTQIKALAEQLDKALPQCLTRKTGVTDTPIPKSAETYLLFPNEVEDIALGGGAGAMHDNATNPGRITIVTPGLYEFYAQTNWNITAGGMVAAWFRKTKKAGGTDVFGRMKMNAGGSPTFLAGVALSRPMRCAKEDYVEVGVFNDQEGTLIDCEHPTFGFGQEFGAIMLSP